MWDRPDENEVEAPYRTSFDQVPDGELPSMLEQQIVDTRRLLERFGEERGDHRYAEGKWSVKEVVGHLADTERVMSYRAMSFARGESIALPGFEQDDYVAAGRFERRRLSEIGDEFSAVRASTLALVGGLDDEMLLRRGTASGASFTVRGLLYVICGHEIHHKRILRERYL